MPAADVFIVPEQFMGFVFVRQDFFILWSAGKNTALRHLLCQVSARLYVLLWFYKLHLSFGVLPEVEFIEHR